MITGNGAYNSPAMAQAAQNIAQMFAPPSAQDANAYSAAALNRQKHAQIEDLFANPNQPDFDRRNIAIGNYAPTQSFYAQDQNNSTQRYGHDRSAQAQFWSNAWDPVAEDAVRAPIDAGVAGMFGGPAQPGLAGPRSPLTQAEVMGGQTQRLIDDGQMTDEMLLALGMKDAPIQAIVDPTTGKPVNAYGAQAVGAEPYFNKGAEAKPEVFSYASPNGKRGSAVYDNELGMIDTQTRLPLPPESQVYKANAQGTAGEIGVGTTSNRTDAQRLRAAISNTNGIVNELETLVISNPATTGMAGDILSFAQDARQVVSEFGEAFGQGPDAILSAEDMASISEQYLGTGTYNPAYRQARSLMLELAYANATMNNPSGEVSRFALERELDALGQGAVGNDKGLLGVLEVSRDRMRRKLEQADVLDGTMPALTSDQIGASSAAPPPPAGGQVPTPQSQADFDALPPGSLYIDPDDGQQYRKP